MTETLVKPRLFSKNKKTEIKPELDNTNPTLTPNSQPFRQEFLGNSFVE